MIPHCISGGFFVPIISCTIGIMSKFDDIVALAKRRGFVFPGSEIYGGLANTYDFGPLGVELLRNIQNYWWDYFVTKSPNIYGLDSSILMSPRVWEASGHTASFTDELIDCKNCQNRTRADHLIEDNLDMKVEGLTSDELGKIIAENKLKCPVCGKSDWTQPRSFNLLFETNIGIVAESESNAYLRGEIAQGMFVNFKNILDTMHPKLPFGLAQSGKAFRNEITLGNFIFRTLEFNLSEFEYFIDPEKQSWEEQFEFWQNRMYEFAISLGLSEENLKWREHTDEERSHYSQRTIDLDFNFSFGGFKEMFGLAFRGDYDLKNHMEKSGVDLRYIDPYDQSRRFIPHVIEPTFGINRIFLAVLDQSYIQADHEVGRRTYLNLPAFLAPYKAAVFPLLGNKEELIKKAREVFEDLNKHMSVDWDDRGNIGKRYSSQDEIGTPYCITVDFDTLKDNTVTVRDRNTTNQERVEINSLLDLINKNIRI